MRFTLGSNSGIRNSERKKKKKKKKQSCLVYSITGDYDSYMVYSILNIFFLKIKLINDKFFNNGSLLKLSNTF